MGSGRVSSLSFPKSRVLLSGQVCRSSRDVQGAGRPSITTSSIESGFRRSSCPRWLYVPLDVVNHGQTTSQRSTDQDGDGTCPRVGASTEKIGVLVPTGPGGRGRTTSVVKDVQDLLTDSDRTHESHGPDESGAVWVRPSTSAVLSWRVDGRRRRRL